MMFIRAQMLLILSLLIGFQGFGQDKSATRPGLMSQPEAGGTISKEEGSFAVQSSTGAPSFSLPLPKLPERAGFGPSISIRYSSSAGESDGLGLGWSLSVPSIVVNKDMGTAIRGRNGASDFVHRLSLNGQRLIYIYREDCDYVHYKLEGSTQDINIVYQPKDLLPTGNPLISYLTDMLSGTKNRLDKGFKVTYPDGRIQYYSAELDASSSDFLAEGTQEEPLDHIIRYPLAVEVAPTGEAVKYRYVKHGGRSYLHEISFAGGKSKYTFELVNASHKVESWMGGFQQSNEKLYSRMIASYDGKIHQQWCFAYSGINTATSSVCQAMIDDLQISDGTVVADQLRAIYRFGDLQSTSLAQGDLQWSPVYFTYSPWNLGTQLSWQLNSFSTFTTTLVDKMELVDYNNDSLVDIVTHGDFDNITGGSFVFPNNGSLQDSFDRNDYLSWKLDYFGSNKAPDFRSSDTHFADINGDGYSDVVIFKDKTASIYLYQAREDDPWNQRIDFDFQDSDQITRSSFMGGAYQFMDLNGDGRSDIIGTLNQSGQRAFHICRNKSWDIDGSFAIRFDCRVRAAPFANSDVALDQFQKHRIIDLNGDGLPDYVRMEPNPGQLTFCAYFNQGDMFADDSTRLMFGERNLSTSNCDQGREIVLSSLSGLDNSKNFEELKFVDLNGDGVTDLLGIYGGNAHIWTGLADGTFFTTPILRYVGDGIYLTGRVRVVDIDGDGQKEVIIFDPQNGDPAPRVLDFNRLQDDGSGSAEVSLVKSNMLTSVEYKSGKRYDLKYSTSIDEMLRDNLAKDYGLHFPLTIVKQIAVSEGALGATRGDVGITEYLYHNPVYDPVDKRFLGFTRVETIKYGDEYLASQQTQESSYVEEIFYGDPRLAGRLKERHIRKFETTGNYAAQSQSSATLDPTVKALHSMSTYTRALQSSTAPGDYLQTEKQNWSTINRSLQATARGQVYYIRMINKESIIWDIGTNGTNNIAGAQLSRTYYDQFDQYNLHQRQRHCMNQLSYAGVTIPAEMKETQFSRDSARTQLSQLSILDKPDQVATYDVPYSGNCQGDIVNQLQLGEQLTEQLYLWNSSNGQLEQQTNSAINRLASAPGSVSAYTSGYADQYIFAYEYDSFGNKIRTIAINSGGTQRELETITYDSNGVFPKTHSNALGHTSQYTYTGGRISSFTDANGQTVTIAYDELGRRTSWSHASGSSQTYSYTDADDGKPAFIETSLKRYNSAPSGEFASIQQLAAYSPLGLELAQMEIAEVPGSVRVLSRKNFNRNKKTIREFVPYVVSGGFATIRSSGAVPVAPGSQPYTAFIWDGLGRITKVTHPGPNTGADRSTTETKLWHAWGELVSKNYYDGQSSRSTSCREIVRRGDLIYGIADELSCGGNGVAHQFSYNSSGQLSAILLAGESNPRSFAYDGFGRMQKQTIPGVGSYYFVYDGWGDLGYRFHFDANGVFMNGVQNSYDSLSRLVAVDNMVLSGSNVNIGNQVEARRYDSYTGGTLQSGSASQVKGLLTEVNAVDSNNRSRDYQERLEYNARGELIYKEVAVGSDSDWYEKYQRTLDGVVRTITNHLGVVAEYGLTASMKMRSVRMSFDGSNYESIISGVTYNGKGQLEQIRYHDDGAITNLEYDPSTLRLTRIFSESSVDLGNGSRTLQDLNMVYNGNNSITSITDNLGNTSWGHVNRTGNFYYNLRDELIRMERFNDTREYAYNAAGAFTRNDDIFGDSSNRGSLDQAFDDDTTLIPRGTTSQPYAFDSAGRIKSNGTVTSTKYDHNNRLIQATTNSQTIYYGYNHEGLRTYKDVVSNADSSSALSLYPLKTVTKEPTGNHSYVFVGDQRLARVENDNNNRWFYYLKDHIGSSDIMMTGGNAAEHADLPVEQMLYRAYGTEYNVGALADVVGQSNAWDVQVDMRRQAGVMPVEKTHHRFTGHYLDDDSGLYYFGARYYDPGLGRFVTADGLFIERPELCIERPLECNLYGYAKNNPIKYIDENGQFVTIGTAMLIAGAVSGTISAASTLLSEYNKHGEISVASGIKAATSFASGAAKGALAIPMLASGGAGLAAFTATAGAINAGEQLINKGIVGNMMQNEKNTFGDFISSTAISTGVDAVGGKVLEGIVGGVTKVLGADALESASKATVGIFVGEKVADGLFGSTLSSGIDGALGTENKPKAGVSGGSATCNPECN